MFVNVRAETLSFWDFPSLLASCLHGQGTGRLMEQHLFLSVYS